MAGRNGAQSLGEALDTIKHQTEIDARQSSYAVATELVKNVATRYGPPDAKGLSEMWTAISDAVFLKIKSDMDTILKGK